MKLKTLFLIFFLFAKIRPLAFELFYITKTISIGDFFFKENLKRFFKLLPFPEINTEVLILLKPDNFII